MRRSPPCAWIFGAIVSPPLSFLALILLPLFPPPLFPAIHLPLNCYPCFFLCVLPTFLFSLDFSFCTFLVKFQTSEGQSSYIFTGIYTHTRASARRPGSSSAVRSRKILPPSWSFHTDRQKWSKKTRAHQLAGSTTKPTNNNRRGIDPQMVVSRFSQNQNQAKSPVKKNPITTLSRLSFFPATDTTVPPNSFVWM